MKKSLAITLLILLGSAATIGIPVGMIAWFNLDLTFTVISPVFTMLAPIAAAILIQTAVFILLRRLYKTKYGLSSPKFVVCSVLPPIGVSMIGMIVIKCMVAAGVFGEENPRVYPDDRAYTEMLSAWTVIAYAVCIAVILSLTLAVISAVENRRNCPKKSALMLLAVFGNLSTYALAIAAFMLMRLLSMLNAGLFIFGDLAVVIAQIIASVMLFRRYRRKFGVSSGEYVGHGALPAFVINAAGGMLGLLFGVIGGADSDWVLFVFSLVFGAYSMAYLIGISAVTSFYDPR